MYSCFRCGFSTSTMRPKQYNIYPRPVHNSHNPFTNCSSGNWFNDPMPYCHHICILCKLSTSLEQWSHKCEDQKDMK